MRLRFAAPAAFLVLLLLPAAAAADATLFLGTTLTPAKRAVRGFAIGASLLVVGFEFEYATIGKDETLQLPSLRTTSGNVFAQTFGFPAFQLYATTGAGVYRERLGPDQETAFVLNNGGGIKVTLVGPIRARIDYRVFNLRGHPKYSTVQRIYAGANLAF
jgi:hypothetical protein